MKGKDIILSNFLSRPTHDDNYLHNIIPISFNMHSALCENYYNLYNKRKVLGADMVCR